VAQWSAAVVAGARSGDAAPRRGLRVWALVVNDVAIAAVSGEALCALGLEV
jgi:hypothetical protein